jgi:enamine deaminase RidA (YjgF/YER057c/UK114 family)
MLGEMRRDFQVSIDLDRYSISEINGIDLGPLDRYIAAMEFIRTSADFPFSAAVIHSGRTLETVLTGFPQGGTKPVPGGAGAELHEIFRQLDDILASVGVTKVAIASARLYLQQLDRDIAEVNAAYRAYFGSHSPNRRAYGVNLQSGMLIEAAFVAELP